MHVQSSCCDVGVQDPVALERSPAARLRASPSVAAASPCSDEAASVFPLLPVLPLSMLPVTKGATAQLPQPPGANTEACESDGQSSDDSSTSQSECSSPRAVRSTSAGQLASGLAGSDRQTEPAAAFMAARQQGSFGHRAETDWELVNDKPAGSDDNDQAENHTCLEFSQDFERDAFSIDVGSPVSTPGGRAMLSPEQKAEVQAISKLRFELGSGLPFSYGKSTGPPPREHLEDSGSSSADDASPAVPPKMPIVATAAAKVSRPGSPKKNAEPPSIELWDALLTGTSESSHSRKVIPADDNDDASESSASSSVSIEMP